MSTAFYYTAAQVMARAGRKSPNAAQQIKNQMPVPDVVLVAPRPTYAWSLQSWRDFAQGRMQPLRDDLLATLTVLEKEERALVKEYTAYEPKAAVGGDR